MMQFLQKLRTLSGGKPVGFKLCIGQPWQFMSIVKAMLETKIVPDFIVVDGSEGGTGAAPIEFSDYIEHRYVKAYVLYNTLVGAGLRDQVKIGASGKIISAFDIASTFALVQIGSIQHEDSCSQWMYSSSKLPYESCPVGVATQDKDRQKALHVPTKAERI